MLDVGAGTGRVALRLAPPATPSPRSTSTPTLLAELERARPTPAQRRARSSPTPPTSTSRSRSALVAVPMQTIQLLPDRDGFFASARRALVPGGRVAVAIATDLEPYDGAPPLPPPDLGAGRRLDLRLPADRDPVDGDERPDRAHPPA